jgi:hypothetical protein
MAETTSFMIFAPAERAAYFTSAPAAFAEWMTEAFPRCSFAVIAAEPIPDEPARLP